MPTTSSHLGVVPDRSPACESLITATAARIDLRVDELAVRLIDRVVDEMGFDPSDEDLVEDLQAAARGSVALITAMARSWTDPHVVPAPHDALVWARSLVARGLPIETLLRVYRIGQSSYHAVWHDELVAGDAPPAVVLEASAAVTAFIFTWIDAISAPLVEAYEDERLRRLRGADAVRAETVAALLAGEPVDVGAAGARLGYELDREHLALVAWVTSDASDEIRDGLEPTLAEVARRLGGGDARALVLRDDPRSATAWVPRPVPSTSATDDDALIRLVRSAGVQLAIGAPARGAAGFATSHDQAQRARRVARLIRRGSPVVRYPEVAILDLLTRDPEAARRVARETLGPLAGDDDGARRLLATLRVYLQEGESFARAARRLGLHENTVSYRVRRAVEIAGHRDPHGHALRAAVELAPLLRAPDEA